MYEVKLKLKNKNITFQEIEKNTLSFKFTLEYDFGWSWNCVCFLDTFLKVTEQTLKKKKRFHYKNWNIDLGKWKLIKTFDPTVGNIYANPIKTL